MRRHTKMRELLVSFKAFYASVIVSFSDVPSDVIYVDI